MTSRVVDLGREDELVTWHEWMQRCDAVMRGALTEEQRESVVFRVTLVDGRALAVAHSLTHVAKGKCEIVPNRWVDMELKDSADAKGAVVGGDAICDVITGYMFVGVGEDNLPTTIAVTPTEIETVECVYVAPEEEPEPFGFARALMKKGQPTMGEVVEKATSHEPPATSH